MIPYDGTRGSGWFNGVGVGVEATGQDEFDIYMEVDRGDCSGSNSGQGFIQSCVDFFATIILGGYPIECCEGAMGSETSFSITVGSSAPIPSETPPPEKPLPCPPLPWGGGPLCPGGNCGGPGGWPDGPIRGTFPVWQRAAADGGGGSRQVSLHPVRYNSGAVELSASDLQTDGFGIPWGHTRRFLNLLQTPQTVGNGMNWTVDQWPFLVINKSFDPDVETVFVKATPGGAWWFDKTTGDYEPRYGERVKFELDSQASVYKLTEIVGTITEFDQQTGMFRKRYDTAGNSVEVDRRKVPPTNGTVLEELK